MVTDLPCLPKPGALEDWFGVDRQTASILVPSPPCLGEAQMCENSAAPRVTADCSAPTCYLASQRPPGSSLPTARPWPRGESSRVGCGLCPGFLLWVVGAFKLYSEQIHLCIIQSSLPLIFLKVYVFS